MIISDSNGSFIQAACNTEHCVVEWGTVSSSQDSELYVAGNHCDEMYPICFLKKDHYLTVYTNEILSHREASDIVSDFISEKMRSRRFHWRLISPPSCEIVCDDISIEPQLSNRPQSQRIVVKGLNTSIYKPILFNCEKDMWECLNDFGIYELREFGNTVEFLDAVDIRMLYKWNAVKIPIVKRKADVLSFYKEVIEQQLDPILKPAGFKRTKNSLEYKRKLAKSKQLIDCSFQFVNSHVTGFLVPSFTIVLEELLPIIETVYPKFHRTNIFCIQLFKLHTNEDLVKLNFYDKETLTSPITLVGKELQDVVLPVLDEFCSVDKLLESYESKRGQLVEKFLGEDGYLELIIHSYLAKGMIKEATVVHQALRSLGSQNYNLENYITNADWERKK